MQKMDVDEDAFDYLPTVVKQNMIYHNRIYTNANYFTDFVVTGGQDPILYDIKGKQILSAFHLNIIFKGFYFKCFFSILFGCKYLLKS